MDQRFQAFILTAENLSMSRAAELTFVSHQCISGHIRSLEQEYNTQLFRRKPHLALTSEGQKLLETLYEIRILENNIKNTLYNKNDQIIGKIIIGMPMSRYTFFAPKIVTALKAEYPHVDISIISSFSQSLEHALEHGTMDIALTTQQEKGKNLIKAYTKEERFLLLISDKLLDQIYGKARKETIERFQHGVNLRDLAQIPLVMYPPTSRLRTAMDSYAKKSGIPFQNVFESNRIETFHELTTCLPAGSMIPQMMYGITEKENISAAEGNYVHAFPIDFSALEIPFNVTILYHKAAFMPEYKQRALNIIADIVDQVI